MSLQSLQNKTKAVSVLEVEVGVVLDFGGISSEHSSAALRRARKGALLTGVQAMGVAGLIDGASNLQRVLGKARQATLGTALHEQISGLVSGCASFLLTRHSFLSFWAGLRCSTRMLAQVAPRANS
jgi:hypothetical protein